MEGDGTVRIEQPPLGKLFIIAGMELFGENAFGWRFFSVTFGTINIVLFYLICRQLALSKGMCFLATFLLTFENMTFIQSSVGMLDVFSLTFMLLSFWLYLRGNYLSSGVSIALGALCKITGAFAIPVILLHWLFTRRTRIRKFAASILIAPAAFLMLRPIFDYFIWHEFRNPITETDTMLTAASKYTFAEASSPEMLSRSWDWIINPEILTYFEDPNYLAMISPSLWALIIPVVCYLVFSAVKGNGTAKFALAWFVGTYFVWVAMNLITDRISYIYYFYFSTGAICIGLALVLSELRNIAERSNLGTVKLVGRIAIPGYLLIHLIAFVMLIPVSYWWKVPICVITYVIARYTMDADKNHLSKV